MTESMITLGVLRSYTRKGCALILDYAGPQVAITVLTDRINPGAAGTRGDVRGTPLLGGRTGGR